MNPSRTQKQIRAEIRAAKDEMNQYTFGTPGHNEAKARFWALQKELGALELKALGIEPCAFERMAQRAV
jgi:hypothetical protein